MIYGMYLSATGIMTNSYRQDVISNNLANSETVGFKRDLARFQERKTALNERGAAGDWSDPVMEHLGGGVLAMPTLVDTEQGDLEPTGNPMDVAIQGNGYFAVDSKTGKHLTRDGRFMLNRDGELILSTEQGQHVLDDKGKPIKIEPGGMIAIGSDGEVTQDGKGVAKIGLFDVADPAKFTKQGSNMLSYPADGKLLPGSGTLRSEFQERANVDPALELAELMDTQRELEANANMLKYQDTMLQRLVNDVGKIS
ncbi:MAG TPA: flagellar hook-basal body protein [Tepidisphaeraceae bacterium]|jgi:flagellar basal-body rod protein FlgG|nr:flagellar hook-basal body protein [Tepidisphaeraceae bacterium]